MICVLKPPLFTAESVRAANLIFPKPVIVLPKTCNFRAKPVINFNENCNHLAIFLLGFFLFKNYFQFNVSPLENISCEHEYPGRHSPLVQKSFNIWPCDKPACTGPGILYRFTGFSISKSTAGELLITAGDRKIGRE